jgi:hypothetical protein
MSPNIPGDKPRRPTSLVPPLLQVGLAVGLFVLAIWAYFHAPAARATDAWMYNALSAVSALAAILWLPFALTSLGRVLANRRKPRMILG